MANQIVVSAGAKVRNLSGVLTATSGVVSFLPIDVSLGIPQLDVNGKILVAQLPNSVMEYQGTWNATTNVPYLVNGVGNAGDVWLVSTGGVHDFGAGAITFVVSDQVIFSNVAEGSIWQKASGSNGTVTSVAITESGDSLNITGSPITTSGTINIGFNGTNLQYVNGAGNLTTFPILTGYVTAVSGTAPVVSSGGTTPAISMAAATGSVDGYLSATDFAIFNAKQSALTFSSPLVNTSGTISIPAATTSVNGYLASADFTTFNNKQNAITLTTTGTSGASTLVGATLNIPNYGSALTGYVPYTGATQDVDLDVFSLNAKSLHIKGTAGNGHLGLKHQSASATASANEVSLFADTLGDLSWLNGNLYLSKFIISSNTAARSYTFPNANGTVALTSDLTGYLTAVTATSPLSSSGGTTPNITISQATTSTNGYLSSTDWNTFNLKQPQLNGTGFVKATGTTISYDNSNYVTSAYFSATNPLIYSSGNFSIDKATTTDDGYLSKFDFNTFNNKQGTITLTTTGTSGAATFSSNTLNIPNYGSALSGYLPLTGGTLTGALSGTSASFSGKLTTTIAGEGVIAGFGANGVADLFTINYGPSGVTNLISSPFGRMILSTQSNNHITLMPNGTGNVGIGTTSPSYLLDVNGTGRFSSTLDASQFNGNLLVGSATVGGNIQLNYGANVVSRSYRLISDAYNYGDFAIQQSTTQTGSTYVNKIILAANGDLTLGSIPSTGVGSIYAGAATFSSTIGTSGDITITKASAASFIANNTSASGKSFRLVSADDGTFRIQNTGVLDILTLAFGGAATFSSTLGIGGVADSVKGGTYTPTINTTTNIASSSVGTWQYLRVGNTVTVSGNIVITATSGATVTSFNFSLPINSTFATGNDCAGTGVDYDATTFLMVNGNSGAANFGLGLFRSTTTAAMTLSIQFTYKII